MKQPLRKFYIRKAIIAKDIRDAIRKEPQAIVSEVYEDYTYIHPNEKKIGIN